MPEKYSRCECPDEEIYLSEEDGYYNLYLKSPYYEENCFPEEPPEASSAEYEAVKDKLPKPYWAGHEEEIKAHDFAWDLAFRHIGQPTKENGFVRSFIETSFNMSTFMGDSSAMMEFTKYAEEVFDFRGTLDNFYSKQHLDGFICREIRADNGKDRFHRFDPISVGPYWLGYTEWDLYCRNRDKKRLGKVFAPLMGLHLWIGRHRRNPDGSYWHTGLSSTMDNQPRVPDGYSLRLDKAGMSWLDANLTMLLDADALIKMSEVLGREGETSELRKEREFLLKYLLEKHWDKEREFFFDVNADGSFNDCKSVGAFWALHVEGMPKEVTDALVRHLLDEREFNRLNPVPSISADSPMYDGNGAYWRGGVWSCTNYMVFSGLVKRGYGEVAFDLAKRHNRCIAEMYRKTGTLWEDSAPDELEISRPSKPDCVGWTALSVISDLYEFVFGITGDGEKGEIEWRVNLTEEFGIENYPFRGRLFHLHCKARKSPEEEPEIRVTGGDVTVKVLWNGRQKIIKATKI